MTCVVCTCVHHPHVGLQKHQYMFLKVHVTATEHALERIVFVTIHLFFVFSDGYIRLTIGRPPCIIEDDFLEVVVVSLKKSNQVVQTIAVKDHGEYVWLVLCLIFFQRKVSFLQLQA